MPVKVFLWSFRGHRSDRRKIVSSLIQPGANVTGLSDMVNAQQQLALIKEFMPGLKKLGVPYNPGETNSVSIIKALQTEAQSMGITVIESAAPNLPM